MKTLDTTPYAKLLPPEFSGVVLRTDVGLAEGVEDPVIDAFMVPDDRLAAFARFAAGRFEAAVETAGLPPVLMIGHSISATRRYYPEVARDAPYPRGTPGGSVPDAAGEAERAQSDDATLRGVVMRYRLLDEVASSRLKFSSPLNRAAPPQPWGPIAAPRRSVDDVFVALRKLDVCLIEDVTLSGPKSDYAKMTIVDADGRCFVLGLSGRERRPKSVSVHSAHGLLLSNRKPLFRTDEVGCT